MKRTLFIVILGISSIGQAQDLITDNKGNFIFGIPTTGVTPVLSSNTIGITTPIWYPWRKLYWVEDATTKQPIYTMQKTIVPFAKANVVSNSKSVLVFNSKTNVSPSLEIGISTGFDTLFYVSEKAGFYFTSSASIVGEYQHFKYYDTLTQTFGPEETRRISPGVKLSLAIFKNTAFALSTSITYLKSVITENLKSYEKRSNTFYFDNNITTNGQVDGYLSPIKPTENLRFSISAPQFWLSPYFNEKIPFVITPYYFGTYSRNSIPNNNVGIVLSFLSSRFRKFDRDVADRTKLKPSAKFKFDKILNVGYNFISSGNKDPRYFFVSGTFNFGVFKPKKDEPADGASKRNQKK